ncbi:mechanosensitive ion channel family protein [Microbulbifer yueqingensis]|uniref:MscS family membrane protein n=1 Tax=Microbulbifer yueqingensis TaxID=658219 RepID=A0A1G9ALZ5_9GAMM|nr:mechanosensitive ion channel family protein [Microbulbifer yueqingensis]SDK28362.1 MscS family membrane protein [Microbulbifer yueqingensis]
MRFKWIGLASLLVIALSPLAQSPLAQSPDAGAEAGERQTDTPEATEGEKPRNPLDPLDMSSPRATLTTFLALGDELGSLARGQYWTDPSRALAEQFGDKLRQIGRLLDLSQIPPAARVDAGSDAAIYLYEVLSRIELPPLEEIPGADEVPDLATVVSEEEAEPKKLPGIPTPAAAEEDEQKKEEGVARSVSWTIPHTEITLVRVAEGPRAGKFIFSADTVARAAEFYQKVRHLPYRREVPLKYYAEMRPYMAMRGWLVPPGLIDSFPDWMKQSIFRQATWKWLALFAVLVLFAGGLLLLQRFSGRFRENPHVAARLTRFLVPLILLLLTRPLASFLHQQLTLTDAVGGTVSLLAEIVSYLALAWLAWVVPPAMMEVYIRRSAVHRESLDAHLFRFIARTLGLAGVIAVAFLLTSRLGAPLYSLLAGFGIGGIAVALAMRGSFENFIGSLNLFGDKPVRVGDFCRYGEDAGGDFQRTGTVESIGMRSTRLRGIDNSVTTIPNADFSQMHIVNYTTRSHILLHTELTLRFETTEDQLRYVLVTIREMLVGHPKVADDEPSVRFSGFGASALLVEIRVDVFTNDFPEYRAICEDIYFRIFRIVRQSGTGFAFPSQTVYFTRDGGIDSERQQEAEHQVREWAAAQQMPFPYFSAERRAALRNTVYYPPEGSPDSEG